MSAVRLVAVTAVLMPILVLAGGTAAAAAGPESGCFHAVAEDHQQARQRVAVRSGRVIPKHRVVNAPPHGSGADCDDRDSSGS